MLLLMHKSLNESLRFINRNEKYGHAWHFRHFCYAGVLCWAAMNARDEFLMENLLLMSCFVAQTLIICKEYIVYTQFGRTNNKMETNHSLLCVNERFYRNLMWLMKSIRFVDHFSCIPSTNPRIQSTWTVHRTISFFFLPNKLCSGI